MWEDLILRPSPWVKPFLPQQAFSTAQVPVTRVGKNLKDPKEPEPTALLYPILQGGTEEELLFPPPYQPLEPLRAPLETWLAYGEYFVQASLLMLRP